VEGDRSRPSEVAYADWTSLLSGLLRMSGSPSPDTCWLDAYLTVGCNPTARGQRTSASVLSTGFVWRAAWIGDTNPPRVVRVVNFASQATALLGAVTDGAIHEAPSWLSFSRLGTSRDTDDDDRRHDQVPEFSPDILP